MILRLEPEQLQLLPQPAEQLRQKAAEKEECKTGQVVMAALVVVVVDQAVQVLEGDPQHLDKATREETALHKVVSALLVGAAVLEVLAWPLLLTKEGMVVLVLIGIV
jgi:hypothetical protein